MHTLTYDILGRVTKDAVTALATGFDGSVRRIESAYDTQGNAYLITSYDAATGGNIVNQIQRVYNGLGQLTKEYQAHSGAVNTSTTPNIQYAYVDLAGGANNSRLTSITYPNGKVLSYNYGTSGGLNDTISRPDNLSDSTGTLEQYSYLGLATVVKRAHSQPGVDLTYIKQTGEANGDGGDQYTGLDRFGRVVDQRWLVTSNGTHTDRFQYGYDRNSNPLYRNNLVNTAFGELYHASGAGNGYDNLNQLSGFPRGVLSASGGSGTPLDTVASPSTTKSWAYDALGNFASTTLNGTQTTRTHNQENEVTAVGSSNLTFDKNGNMTTDDQGHTLVYDAWNRLVQVKNGSTTLASYKFDGLGRRIVEVAGTNTRDLYFSSSWQVLEERLNSATTADVQNVWSPIYVNALILRDRSTAHNGTLDERLWVQQDANWNVTALVNGSGNVAERYAYDPYGAVTYLNSGWSTISSSAYAVNYLFQGERLDTATGLYHMDRRDYSATLGRWVTLDPIRLSGRDINLYRGEANRPLTFGDPSGLAVEGKKFPAPGWKPEKTKPQPGGYKGGGWNPGNWARWLYTGDPNCPDEIYNGALQEGADGMIKSGELGDAHNALDALGPAGMGVGKVLEAVEGEEGHKLAMKNAMPPPQPLVPGVPALPPQIAPQGPPGPQGFAAGPQQPPANWGQALNRGIVNWAPVTIAGAAFFLPWPSDSNESNHVHHNLPQQFKPFFEDAGLNIEDFTEEMPNDLHQQLHSNGVLAENNWNEDWKQFIHEYPDAGPDQILEHLEDMRAERGLPPLGR